MLEHKNIHTSQAQALDIELETIRSLELSNVKRGELELRRAGSAP